MLLTPHLLSGMMSGSLFSAPFASALAGIVSYFVLEIIPHWDPENFNKKRVLFIRYLDISFAFLAFAIVSLLKEMDKNVIIGGIAAGIPYLIFTLANLYSDQGHFFKKTHKLKRKIKYTDRSLWGILIQFAISIICIAIIFKLLDFPTWDKIKTQVIF